MINNGFIQSLTPPASADKIHNLMSVDPSRPLNFLSLAKSVEKLDGTIQLDQMPRVTDLLWQTKGNLSYCLSFAFDEATRIRINVGIKTQVNMICQRCLQPMQVAISRESWLAIVNDKSEMERLPYCVEPLVLTELDEITCIDLLEDELLMVMPFAPMHPEAQCSASKEMRRLQTEGKVNHFAILAKLKGNLRKS